MTITSITSVKKESDRWGFSLHDQLHNMLQMILISKWQSRFRCQILYYNIVTKITALNDHILYLWLIWLILKKYYIYWFKCLLECFLRSLVYNAGSATLVWNSPTPLFREAALTWHKKQTIIHCAPRSLKNAVISANSSSSAKKSANLLSPAGILKGLVLINKQTPTLIYPVKCPCTSLFICLDMLSVAPFTATVSQASGYYRSASNLLPIWDGVSDLILRHSVNWSNCIPIITAVDSGEEGELGPLWKIQFPITMETRSFLFVCLFCFFLSVHIWV